MISEHFCIAISGKSGCGNTTVSRALADELKFKHINYTFRDMAKEMEIPFDELRAKAEEDSKWDQELDRHQMRLAALENSVVGSRLAIWLLREKAFTVYLDAPLEVRCARIAKREDKSLEQAIAENEQRDRLDHQRFLHTYGYDTDEFGFADLLIDVSELSVGEIVETIMAAFRIRTGWDGPSEEVGEPAHGHE